MQQQSQKRTLVLASTSPYRKILLKRLGLPFEVFSPRIDESRQAGESPTDLVTRLAGEKTLAAAHRFPSAVVIGSDQVATCQGEVVGKPGHARNAIAQLTAFSGQTVQFLTAVSITCREAHFCHERTIATNVRFRQLSNGEIRRYIEIDNPLDCAGSFKSEAAGISLLEAMSSEDPTAIIGLPLITVSDALRQVGFKLP
jgi:septum formation protein